MPTTFLKNPVSVNVAASAVGLHVTGSAAAPTAGSGTQPSNTLTIEGVTGQETTGSGQTAGIGANVSITAGTGGAAPSGSTNGAGGSVTINPGPPGTGAGTAAADGNVLLATGGGNIGAGTASPTTGAKLDVNGVAMVANGTVSNPSLVSRSDPDTGIYWGGTNTLHVATDAAARMTVDASGHVGIGNTAPGSRLTVGDGSQDDAFPVVIDSFNSNPITELRMSRWVGAFRGPILAFGARTTDGVATSHVARIGGFKENGTQGDTTGNLRFYVNNGTDLDTAMTIDGARNVGIGITTPGSALHVNGGVQVGTPTGGDKGAGSINVSGDIYKNGTAFTNPDYVFEHHFNGSTQADYAGPVPLAQLEDTLKTHGQLPGVGREPKGIFGRQDVLLEKLEEAYLYIIELTKRVDRLEARHALTSDKENA
jgi:hypothetical protein